MTDIAALRRALERERKARREAERLLEERARELYEANATLRELNASLEHKVTRRTVQHQRTNRRLSALIEGVPVGVLAEDGERRIIAVNRKFCDLFGIQGDPERLVGADCAAMAQHAAALFEAPKEFAARTKEVALARERTLGDQLTLRDGRVFRRDFIPIVGDDDDDASLWLYADVTAEQAAREELIRAKGEAEAGNKAKVEFLGMMSHEMRTPLAVVLGMTELLLDEESLSAAQMEYAERALRNGEALKTMIEDILQFSKLQAGVFEIRDGTFSVPQLLDEVADLMKPQAQRKGLELVVRPGANLPRSVHGDGQRLRQVLVNLVGNAVKFTPSGSVTVTAKAAPGESAPHRVRYEVADTGVGIPEPMQGQVFERFVRVRGGGTPRVTGTGLGLSITQALVSLMGGSEVGIESAVGTGSRFSFTLDHQPSVETPTSVPAPPAWKTGRRLRVLVAEDDADNRLLVIRRLEGMGFEVHGAADGKEGFERARGGRYDAVVADMEMPEWNGLELTRRLRAWEAEACVDRTPVVMLSAHAMPTHRAQAEAAGVDDYLTKPVRTAELTRSLHEALGERCRVLIVDDDEDITALMALVLERADILVETALCREEALPLVARFRFDAVLVDGELPDTSGDALAAELRELVGMQTVPILAVTGHAEAAFRERLLAAGCDDVLIKPLRRDQLVQAVRRAVKPQVVEVSTARAKRECGGDNEPIRIRVAHDIADLVPSYLERRRADAERLHALLADGDFPAVRTLGHQLKGSGAGYGFARISEIGSIIERAAEAAEKARLTEAARELANFLSRVVVESASDSQ